MTEDVRREVAAVWRIESAKILATLTRTVGDLDLAEDLAGQALLEAVEQWPTSGVPRNPAAWLTSVARRRAIDGWRRKARLDERYAHFARELENGASIVENEPWDPDRIDDDILRLIFIACHPVLNRKAQVALTLRIVGGLTTEEIAKAFLISTATVQQRIVRAKKTLTSAKVAFEVPERAEFARRLGGVLSVVYLVFNEGYAASSGEEWMRTDLSNEALRLARILAELVPQEPEVHGLVALMELTASRFGARTDPDGVPILLSEQNRTKWDRGQITRGLASLARADAIGRGRGPYSLQAGIAECHAVAATFADTDWKRIVLLYEALQQLAPSPVVDLNLAAAVSMAYGPVIGLEYVDKLVSAGTLSGYHLLPSVRGDLLAQLGRIDEARIELLEAARLAGNERERAVLTAKAAELGSAQR
ncbi:RNA polymerase sigma factor [Rhodococcus sp. PAMC28707]|uniref:RNA polymerase sigma factor n=1 Tax=unclassified Rhodococcus (in: high G+C Gram-positive bacteria) TaxID=192944 RepID=UPI00109E1F5D|nr:MULTISPECIES: RNA polymerase sigma factor [unclassified Rhodococcus (in: high G+C Gram-positive bacteria)]QCB51888.1 RNA polymerase sigma factor [Rhodococcus sp. PAMC28705]QCB59942.1 RNA polymerase sigma factor [Rhodococcus sp. PAMC28707]